MYLLAFITGLIGSLHCVGMCGPIMLVLAPNNKSLFTWLLYHIGRTFTYSILGLLLGALGSVFVFAGWQQFLSIGMGLLIIFFSIAHILGKNWQVGIFNSYLFHKIGFVIKSKNPFSKVVVGMLNGFLPCGLVYAAFAGAVATADIYKGMIYMGLFGLGTMPLMLLLGYFKNQIAGKISFNKYIPYYTITISIFIILRGLNLNIPYLSPAVPTAIKSNTEVNLHCSPTPPLK